MFNNIRSGVKRAGSNMKRTPRQIDFTKSVKDFIKTETLLNFDRIGDKRIKSDMEEAKPMDLKPELGKKADIDSVGDTKPVFNQSESFNNSDSDSDSDYSDCPPIRSDGCIAITIDNCMDAITTWRQLKRATLTARQMEQILEVPNFKAIVIGSFVALRPCPGSRLSILQVVGIRPGKKFYKLGYKTTNLVLRLKIGPIERHFIMCDVANEKPTRKEFAIWYAIHQINDLTLPTNLDIYIKQNEIERGISLAYFQYSQFK
ncbi:uncharacterized protein LOC108105059 [Drosophila eugracilis]|uniref:uncharacterized protein LOC108105059 n=1 Tax=Drosophila eugracilis TaxID=29029 RepID=UPI0007E67B63|nr:uncharacterized protein LOC108105059 [Drosophila eugracilis]